MRNQFNILYSDEVYFSFGINMLICVYTYFEFDKNANSIYKCVRISRTV